MKSFDNCAYRSDACNLLTLYLYLVLSYVMYSEMSKVYPLWSLGHAIFVMCRLERAMSSLVSIDILNRTTGYHG